VREWIPSHSHWDRKLHSEGFVCLFVCLFYLHCVVCVCVVLFSFSVDEDDDDVCIWRIQDGFGIVSGSGLLD
jgi:hypothetical protein